MTVRSDLLTGTNFTKNNEKNLSPIQETTVKSDTLENIYPRERNAFTENDILEELQFDICEIKIHD
jgi:hypothetical protein